MFPERRSFGTCKLCRDFGTFELVLRRAVCEQRALPCRFSSYGVAYTLTKMQFIMSNTFIIVNKIVSLWMK